MSHTECIRYTFQLDVHVAIGLTRHVQTISAYNGKKMLTTTVHTQYVHLVSGTATSS